MEKNELNFSGVAHIAFGVKDIEIVSKKIAEVFQIETPEVNDPGGSDEKYPVYYRGKKTNAYYKYCHLNIGNMEFEPLKTVGRSNAVSDFLKKNGNGIHHILFKVKDLNSMKNNFLEKGLELIEEGSFQGGRYAFIFFHEIGSVIELCELES